MRRLTTAVFGCGCFWTKEHLFSQLHGVVSTRVGFMGGWVMNPSYAEVCQKTTGHAEVVEVTFDRDITSYSQLLKAFFSFHDSSRDRRSKGGQYRSVLFCRKAKERVIAERAIELLKDSGMAVFTTVEPAGILYEAEKRHQRYVNRTGHHVDKKPNPDLSSLTLVEAASLKAA